MYKNSLPIFDQKKCILFALGRNAIYAACMALGLNPGDEVLTPAFDCDGSLQPFKVLGYRLKFFRQEPYTFNVDIDDIKRQISPRTKLLHIINHFGMPQPWDKLLQLRGEIGIPILEDNAYSLFSGIDGKLFGTFGDVSIFSLRKNLPLVDGGMLRINNAKYSFQLMRKNVPWLYPSETLRLLGIIKNNLGFSDFALRLKQMVFKTGVGSEPPPLYSEKEKGFPKWPLRDIIGKDFSCDYLRPMSELAKFQLSKFSREDYAGIIKKKREFYHYLSGKLCGFPGIKVLWPELPEGVVPFCLSCLIESRRDALLAALRRKYSVMAWPTLSMAVLEQLQSFPEVELLGRKLLQINFPEDKIRLPNSSRYLENLIQDIRELSGRYVLN